MSPWKASAEFERQSSNAPARELIKGVFVGLGISIVLFALGVMGVLYMVEKGWIN